MIDIADKRLTEVGDKLRKLLEELGINKAVLVYKFKDMNEGISWSRLNVGAFEALDFFDVYRNVVNTAPPIREKQEIVLPPVRE